MIIPQIDGSSELAPSDLKGSTTGRQSSSVMLQHMEAVFFSDVAAYGLLYHRDYCVAVVQAGKPFRCSEGNVVKVYESLANNAKVTK